MRCTVHNLLANKAINFSWVNACLREDILSVIHDNRVRKHFYVSFYGLSSPSLAIRIRTKFGVREKSI